MPSTSRAEPVEAQDDRELLARIARQDRDAFEVLFERHKSKAYTLALYITGNSITAEEAVQEAMIRVWSRASTYNGAGTVEGWILRIVARDASHTFRNRKRRSSERMIDEQQPAEHVPPQKRLAETELILLLRQALTVLSGPERELIALRFAAGMSQQEISRELNMPQQTISYRIDAILKRLRGLLPKGDSLLAAAPLAELLRQAVLTGPAHPPLLCPDVTKIVRDSVRRSLRLRPPVKSNAWAGIGAAAGVAAIAAAVVLSQKSAPATAHAAPSVTKAIVPPVTPAPSPIVAAKAPAVPAAAPVNDTFSYTWTFEHGIPKEFFLNGDAKWNARLKVYEAAKGAVIGFPFKVNKRPVILSFTCSYTDRNQKYSKYGISVMEDRDLPWMENHTCTLSGAWVQMLERGDSPGFECTTYIYGDRVVDTLNGKVFRVAQLAAPCTGNRVLVVLTNTRINRIEARTVELNDIPAQYRADLATLTKGLPPVPSETRPQEKK